MAIVAVDILIKSMLEAAIADLRRNDWILEDVFSGLAADPLSNSDYGYKEVAAAIKWFKSNQIDVILQFRNDAPKFPCITVVSAQRTENLGRTNLADDQLVEEIDPSKVTIQPVRVLPAFTPKSYDPSQGLVELPSELNTSQVCPGQFYVSQKSGKAYQILEVLGDSLFKIKAGVREDFKDGYIVPATSLWNLQRELTFVKETFHIGCHAQSDPAQCQWLHDLVWYCLLRYKEAYLEGRGFDLSTMSSGPMQKNPNFPNELILSRFIDLTGDVQADWIKWTAPKLQSTKVDIRIADGPKTPPGYRKQAKNQGWRMENDDDSDKD